MVEPETDDDRFLPFGMTRKPYETVDPDDDEQTSLFDFEKEEML